MNRDSRSFAKTTCPRKKRTWREIVSSEGKTDALGVDLRTGIASVRLESEKLRVEMQEVRADIFHALRAQTWKMFGFGVVLVTAVHFVTRARY
jgi:hypothetical protein